MITGPGLGSEPRRQQKCLSHIPGSIKESLETKKGRGRSFGNQLKGLLQEAIAHQLRNRVLPDRANRRRLLDEICWHHDRGNLLWFLEDPRIESTNNRAKRAL